jgi:hypothetical protein
LMIFIGTAVLLTEEPGKSKGGRASVGGFPVSGEGEDTPR